MDLRLPLDALWSRADVERLTGELAVTDDPGSVLEAAAAGGHARTVRPGGTDVLKGSDTTARSAGNRCISGGSVIGRVGLPGAGPAGGRSTTSGQTIGLAGP
jgi:hypothetical protein